MNCLVTKSTGKPANVTASQLYISPHRRQMETRLPDINFSAFFAAAPEVILNSRHYNGALADVWSAGVMLYVRFCLHHPPVRKDVAAICKSTSVTDLG